MSVTINLTHPRSNRIRILESLIFLLLFGLLWIQPVFAQTKSISGKVIDLDTGQPVLGVNIFVKGTTNGTSSGEGGQYTLSGVSTGNILTFSILGYASQEITVGAQQTINVSLQSSTNSIEEMVVVGYGRQKKRNLTGSVVSVGSEEIDKTALQDPISILQGRAAGVQVTSNSGAPGGEMTIRVRGNSSLNSGNNPLFVVDGIPIESNSISSLNGSENFGLNPLADLNPTDIASIEVLKDAASTAIYGSRAANGVVMITTKRGAAGKPEVTMNVTTGLSELSRKLSVLNATQYRQLILDSYTNLGTTEEPYFTIIDSLNPMNNGDVDWQEELMRTAAQYKVDFAVRGGNQNTKYAWSSSYLDQDGVILNSNYKRITSRLNVDFNISDKLTVGQSVSFTNGTNNRINAGGVGNLSVIRELLVRPPIMSMYLPDGSLNGYSLGRRNPVGIALYATHLNKSNRLIGSQYVEYAILPELKFRSNLNFDYISMKEDEFMPSILDYREGYNTGAVRSSGNLTWGNESYFSYNKTVDQVHNFGALLGLSFQKWRFDRTGLDGMFFPSDDIRTLNAAGVISNQGINVASEHAMLSYFGRFSYDYQSKYLAEFNLRADGSSRFGRDQRFGYFPSASVGWRFSEESGLDGLGFLDDGKLRFSAGMTGNEAIGDYTSQGEFSLGSNYLDFSGAAPTVMPNAGLTWETTTQYNAGLDMAFLANRLSLTVDLYLKNTKDLLYNVPIPNTTGFNYITQNIGTIQNRGAEFLVTSKNLVGKFGWNSNLNISLNRNKVTSLPENLLTNGYIQNGNFHILQEGLPIGVFYGWEFDGVYARDEDNVNGVTHGALGPVFEGGDPIWRDLNGDNIINQDDRQIIGYAEPKFFGGISNDFSYKNFSLNVFFQFSYGNEIYSEINHQRNSVVRYNNLSTDALSRWREQGDITNFPKPVRDDPKQSDSRVQSRWVEDGSYIKLKNVNLRYSFAPDLVKRIGLYRLDAFVTASNLITWTKYTGFDPDVNSYSGLRVGVDEGSYPQSRTFIFGLNIGL
ncbi:SusC/RagA family TonB-linked outer membrane protein [Sphingobacterium hungaricum]|uniref:TonB-dependent receptor n=1 Tax=Sphingobacterium hungaricum TaxID=2082723 RepID=A0A928UVY1_9SPHI|nr:TonB-dependent receptor [Sphingobacterium hungaricum]MBE8714220.1 TonB-dependent receptor [Sphingobacterium hungaricum]